MYLLTAAPFRGAMLEKIKRFLTLCDLTYDPCIQFTALLMDEDEIIATGSLDGNTIKCMAVAPDHQGEDLTGRILTVLLQEAAQRGVSHLMLYTKPRNQYLFAGLGFHPVIRTADVLLMENRRNGLESLLAALKHPTDDRGPVGCIVANANPFTLGHRYLVERAARECAWVYMFVLSEDKSTFSTAQRMRMSRAACADLPNVLVGPTGPYMVSSATFPSYFIKEKASVPAIQCELDIRLFGEKIAPALNITRRYVGDEPLCPITAQYNAHMKALLPGYGIELIELPRLTSAGEPISASRVRALLQAGDADALAGLLPPSTLEILRENTR